MSSTTDRRHSPVPAANPLLESALAQIREDVQLYNEAVRSYNTHLDNHRDLRGLHGIPDRSQITSHDVYDDAIDGDRAALERLLAHLIDQAHLDSQLRRHPRAQPVHLEATEQLHMARNQLVTTLEESLQHIHDAGDSVPQLSS